MQLIYDLEDTETDGTIGFICADIDEVSPEVKAAFAKIGVSIPSDQRYLNILCY